MRFNGICILSPDVERLGAFYSELLQVPTEREGDNITFFTEGAQLAIYSYAGMERMSPGSIANPVLISASAFMRIGRRTASTSTS